MAYPGPPQYGQAQAYPSGPEQDSQKNYTNYGYDQTSPLSERAAATSVPPPVRMVDPASSGAVAETDAFNAASFSDKAIRHSFIKKVYLILTAQLLVTIAFICVFIFVEPIKNWIQNDGLWFYIVAYFTFLITYFVLVCCPSVRRNYPGNFICLCVFTFAFSYMAATISSFHDTDIVFLAMGITGAVCLAVSAFAIQTKIDFTMCSGLLFALVMVLFFFGWTCLIVNYTWGFSRVPVLNCVYAGLGALVFALFLVYDTQMIMGGKKIELSPEEYIYGALQLYIDVVYIFLYLLALFGKSN